MRFTESAIQAAIDVLKPYIMFLHFCDGQKARMPHVDLGLFGTFTCYGTLHILWLLLGQYASLFMLPSKHVTVHRLGNLFIMIISVCPRSGVVSIFCNFREISGNCCWSVDWVEQVTSTKRHGTIAWCYCLTNPPPPSHTCTKRAAIDRTVRYFGTCDWNWRLGAWKLLFSSAAALLSTALPIYFIRSIYGIYDWIRFGSGEWCFRLLWSGENDFNVQKSWTKHKLCARTRYRMKCFSFLFLGLNRYKESIEL